MVLGELLTQAAIVKSDPFPHPEAALAGNFSSFTRSSITAFVAHFESPLEAPFAGR